MIRVNDLVELNLESDLVKPYVRNLSAGIPEGRLSPIMVMRIYRAKSKNFRGVNIMLHKSLVGKVFLVLDRRDDELLVLHEDKFLCLQEEWVKLVDI